ncbi:MAG: hypothetical protein QME42_05310 [bacterium]|nr:hypothetical protein [bacterium]
MTKEKDIELIELPKGLLDGEFYVCSVQLKTPFWDEVNKNQKGTYKYIGWKSEALEKRKNKIKKLFQEIKDKFITKNRQIKILVFPEYSIEESMIEILKEFAIANQTIIVAGMYEQDERQSVVYVFIPNNEKIDIYKQYKLTTSRLDEDYLSDVQTENKKYYRFYWQPDEEKNKMFIQVFVCHDFLSDSVCNNIDTSMGGLIVVPMCSPRVDEFYGLSSYFVRSPEGHYSIVALLCNAADVKTSKKYDETTACGETQIVGPYDRSSSKIERFSEGGIIAEINLSTVLTRPTRTKREDVITDLMEFFIKEDGTIEYTDVSISGPKYIINPNALLHVGLHKIYAFFCIKNYHKFKRYAMNLPFQTNGVFGIYDILIQGHEEDFDCFQHRLRSYLGIAYDDLKDPDLPSPKYYPVTHVLKYRGENLMSFSEGKFISIFNFSECGPGYLENNLKNMRAIALRKDDILARKDDFENKGIIFKVEDDSDILPSERKMGLEEYLVFLEIYPSGERNIRLATQEFQNSILPDLVENDKVRTIEFCGPFIIDSDYPEGNYIFHIVGNLKNIREIVLSIHSLAYERQIRCRTFVVPAAEKLSEKRYPSLNETILRSPELREVVYTIIYYLKFIDPSNPFIIKYLPHDMIEKIANFYVQYRNAVKGSEGWTELLNKVNQFIYGLCWGFLNEQNLNKEIMERLHMYCSETYSSIARGIESFLDKKRNEILNHLQKMPEETRNTYKDNLKSIKIAKDKYVYSVIEDTSKSILGDLQPSIIKWNKNVDSKYKIEDEEFNEGLKTLQTPIEYRNYFSHGFKKEMEKKQTKEFVKGLLESAITSFNFVSKYCKEVDSI